MTQSEINRINYVEKQIKRITDEGLANNVSISLGKLTKAENNYLIKRYKVEKDFFGFYRFSLK